MYSKAMYHPDGRVKLAGHAGEVDELTKAGFVESPAEFGVETCPGVEPDPDIAANAPGAEPVADAPVTRRRRGG